MSSPANINRFAVARAVIAALLFTVALTFTAGNAHALNRWQRALRAVVRRDNVAKRALGKRCHDRKFSASKASYCDLDGDGFVNSRERNFPSQNGKRVITNFKKVDTDADRLTDYEELLKYGTLPRRADTDGDGLGDGDEVLVYGTDPLNPDSNGNGISDGEEVLNNGECQPPNFDSGGNTTHFGIPSGAIGNISRGNAVYAQNCQLCHPLGDRGNNLQYAQIDAAITGATGKPMNIHLMLQDLADLTAWLNRTQIGGTGNCPTPTPLPGTPLPTATPAPANSPTPTATPCPGGGSTNFDAQGNTTAFGIPSPLIGNISLGQAQYNATCTTCHQLAGGIRGGTYSFSQLKSAFLTNPFMNGTYSGPVVLNDQQISHVIAFAHQGDTGGCTGGATPTATPTPNPISQGAAIFMAACVECHSFNAQGRPREMDYHPSRHKIHEALWSGPDEMPQFRNLTLGEAAPPYSASEEALWQYLNSLP